VHADALSSAVNAIRSYLNLLARHSQTRPERCSSSLIAIPIGLLTSMSVKSDCGSQSVADHQITPLQFWVEAPDHKTLITQVFDASSNCEWRSARPASPRLASLGCPSADPIACS
jgi:hypothetical protein